MANIWLSVKQTLISAGRFVQLLERRPSVRAAEGEVPPTCAGHLRIAAVGFSYAGCASRAVLKDFELDAPPVRRSCGTRREPR